MAEAPQSETEEDAHAASEPELKPEKSLKNIREVGPASSSEPARFLEAAAASGSSSNRFEHFKAKVVFTLEMSIENIVQGRTYKSVASLKFSAAFVREPSTYLPPRMVELNLLNFMHILVNRMRMQHCNKMLLNP